EPASGLAAVTRNDPDHQRPPPSPSLPRPVPASDPPPPEGPGEGAVGFSRRPFAVRSSTVETKITLAVGQIRLLRPNDAPGVDRPIYVALLQEAPPTAWQVVPFSRFAEPAVPGEWLTGRNEPPLRVLGLWNTRLLPAPAVQRSWLVGELSETELERAHNVWRHCQPDQAAPVEWA